VEPGLAVVGSEGVGGEGGGGGDAAAGEDDEVDAADDLDHDDAFLPGLVESRGSQWLPPSAWAVRVVAAATPLLVRTTRPMRRTILEPSCSPGFRKGLPKKWAELLVAVIITPWVWAAAM
jgi:hypothetical protein